MISQLYSLAIEKMNQRTEYCTRVSAPTTTNPDLNPILNDGIPLNPHGLVLPDRGESGSKVPRRLKFRTPIIFSTLNVRTIGKPERLQELVYCAKQHKVDVISIQEHRLLHRKSDFEYK